MKLVMTCPLLLSTGAKGIFNSMFNSRLAFTLSMSENLQLCPECKQGHLRYTSDAAVKVEIKPPLSQTGSTKKERICDHCGHIQIDQYLNEYGEPASDLLRGTATKANPEEKRDKSRSNIN
jgi:hypothetical protein